MSSLKKILSLLLAILFSLSVSACAPGHSAREKALIQDCQQLVTQKVSGEFVNESDRLAAELAELVGKIYKGSAFVATYENLKFLEVKVETGFISGTYSAESSNGGSLSGLSGTYSCFVDGSAVTIDDYDFPHSGCS